MDYMHGAGRRRMKTVAEYIRVRQEPLHSGNCFEDFQKCRFCSLSEAPLSVRTKHGQPDVADL
jgi:hypothetical protein